MVTQQTQPVFDRTQIDGLSEIYQCDLETRARKEQVDKLIDLSLGQNQTLIVISAWGEIVESIPGMAAKQMPTLAELAKFAVKAIGAKFSQEDLVQAVVDANQAMGKSETLAEVLQKKIGSAGAPVVAAQEPQAGFATVSAHVQSEDPSEADKERALMVINAAPEDCKALIESGGSTKDELTALVARHALSPEGLTDLALVVQDTGQSVAIVSFVMDKGLTVRESHGYLRVIEILKVRGFIGADAVDTRGLEFNARLEAEANNLGLSVAALKVFAEHFGFSLDDVVAAPGYAYEELADAVEEVYEAVNETEHSRAIVQQMEHDAYLNRVALAQARDPNKPNKLAFPDEVEGLKNVALGHEKAEEQCENESDSDSDRDPLAPTERLNVDMVLEYAVKEAEKRRVSTLGELIGLFDTDAETLGYDPNSGEADPNA